MAETRGNAVKLVSTTYAVFSSLETKSPDTLYFITDQHQLYKGADLYGSNVSLGSEAPSAANNPIDGLYIQESGTVGSAKNYKLFYNNGSEQIELGNIARPVISGAIADEASTEGYDSSVATVGQIVAYVKGKVATIEAGVGAGLMAPVQTATQLAALTAQQGVRDKILCLVEDSGMLYRYDEQSEAQVVEGNANVIAPTSGLAGKWVGLLASSIAVSNDNFEWTTTGQLQLKASIRTQLEALGTPTEGAKTGLFAAVEKNTTDIAAINSSIGAEGTVGTILYRIKALEDRVPAIDGAEGTVAKLTERVAANETAITNLDSAYKAADDTVRGEFAAADQTIREEIAAATSWYVLA